MIHMYSIYIALADTISERGDLQRRYKAESAAMTAPTLPSTDGYMADIAKYLQSIFSCPAILLHNKFYEILDINHPTIIKVFKLLGYHQQLAFQLLANEYNMNVLDHPNKLTETKFLKYKFHTLWIVKRPLNGNNSMTSFSHWALKFESMLCE